jgi:hypothetical protein
VGVDGFAALRRGSSTDDAESLFDRRDATFELAHASALLAVIEVAPCRTGLPWKRSSTSTVSTYVALQLCRCSTASRSSSIETSSWAPFTFPDPSDERTAPRTTRTTRTRGTSTSHR